MRRRTNTVRSLNRLYQTCLLVLFLVVVIACEPSGTAILTPIAVTPLSPSPIVIESSESQCELSLAERLLRPDISYAIHNNDNDLALSDERDGTLIPVPRDVVEKIHELALAYFQSYGLQDTCIKLADVYGPVIYQIDAPRNTQLFILQLTAFSNALTYHLILFDPTQSQVTPAPPSIVGYSVCGRDQCELLEAPYVSFDDINQNGEEEIVFQRQAHNGTFNAVQYLYYDIAPDLSLTTIFVLETRVPHPSESTQIYVRNIQKLQPNQLKIETYLLDATNTAVITDLGFVILEAIDATSPFRVLSKNATSSDDRDWLVTFMPYEENDFLKGVFQQR